MGTLVYRILLHQLSSLLLIYLTTIRSTNAGSVRIIRRFNEEQYFNKDVLQISTYTSIHLLKQQYNAHIYTRTI